MAVIFRFSASHALSAWFHPHLPWVFDFSGGRISGICRETSEKRLVKTGVYGKFRHPQYLALTLLGVGILLTWGRFIAFIAFFVMMWLYFFLSKSEERKCLEIFGEEYEVYRQKTCFLFPGDEAVFAIGRRFPSPKTRWVAITISFLLIVGISTGGGFLIKGVRPEFRSTIPVVGGVLMPSDAGAGTVKLLMVKGPVFQASPFQWGRDQFMEKAFEMLASSQKIKQALSRFDLGGGHTLLVFLTPGSKWHGGSRRDDRTVSVNAFILVMRTPVVFTGDNFKEFRKNRRILKLIQAREMRFGRLEAEQDSVEGEVTVSGPSFGTADESFQRSMEERIWFFLSGI